MTRCPKWAPMRCPATITTSTITPCSGRTSAPTPSGGWRRSRAAMIAAGTADFRAALPEGGRLLGLDVGTKTIGTALCDAGWTIATAGRADPADQVRQGPGGAEGADRGAATSPASSIGLPLNLDGSEQPAHPVGPRLRPQPGAARPADPALGRALVDPGGDPHPDRRRRQPRAARRAGRQDGRRLHPPGRDRRVDDGLTGRRLTGASRA